MLIDELKNYSAPCFRDDPPPCTAACPLGLDVRALIDKVQRKNFTAAYRLYRNHVLFPAIISRICLQPCREICVRSRADRSVDLKAIETACVAHTKDERAVAFSAPAKAFTVAVVGAGLSGLACALKLASRNYQVKIYDQAGRLGGRLWNLLPPDIIETELKNQFHGLEYQFFPGHRIDDLNELEAEAVFLAPGPGGPDFGLTDQLDRQSLGSQKPGVFLGGGLLGAEGPEAVEQGIRASFSIEKYLKVGRMDGFEETYLKPSVNEKFYLLPLSPAGEGPALAAGVIPSPEEALAEGGRCQRCQCEMCRTDCDMMRAFKTVPPKMTTDAIASVGSKESITNRVGMKMVNACSQCGLCRRVCPESVDMEMCLLEARRQMHKERVMPPAYHDFWLRDMNFSNQAAYLVHAPAGGVSSRVFFPGCQLGASDPDYVLKTYEYLAGIYPDLALIQSCCGVPADWAGDEELRDSALGQIKRDWEKLGRPTFILACPTCRKTFGRYFPEADSISLYEVLAEHPPARPLSAAISGPVSIFDPCSSRDDPAMQAGVRRLAAAWGAALEELEHSGDRAQCCGFGGQIQAVRPSLVDDIVADRIAQADHEYICYCTNCRDIFAVSGKACRHVLDLLFTGRSGDRRPPSLGQRRKNRLLVKRALAGPDDGSNRPDSGPEEPAMNLIISDELSAKMDRLLILEEEVRAAVAHCETGQKLWNSKTGLFSGHLKIGFITYWVTYAQEEAALRLVNVYSHRMTIVDEPGTGVENDL